MISCIEQFSGFLLSSNRNIWLEDKKMAVYVRKSKRYLDNVLMNCVDIGSVNIEEKYRGKGTFSSFLKKIEKINPYKVIYIENILNDNLAKHFKKIKWIEIKGIVSSFYKKMDYKK